MRSIPGQGNALETEPSFDDAACCPFESFYRANRNEKQPDCQYHYAYLPVLRICCTFDGKSGAKPSACRFRGNNLRPALSGCSKNKTMQPPAPGTRAVGCSFSAASENADFSRRVSRRTTPAWQKRRSKRCGLKARAEGTVCLQTRE